MRPPQCLQPEPELGFDELGLGVSDDEIAATFAPFVREQYDREDPEWIAVVNERRAHGRRKFLDPPEADRQKWTTERTLRSYAKTWGVDFETWPAPPAPSGHANGVARA